MRDPFGRGKGVPGRPWASTSRAIARGSAAAAPWLGLLALGVGLSSTAPRAYAQTPTAAPAQPGAAAPAVPAPATEIGVIAGTVIDSKSGEPVIDAGVELVGKGRQTRTDLDGRYALKVAPGVYDVRIYAPSFQSARIEKITVTSGKTARGDAALLAAGAAGVQVVEVVAQADKSTKAVQLIQRKNADVVSDTVSAQEIRESPDSDAAEIVTRAPAVTVQEGGFVYIRGLGERYSSSLLNGSRLPSTDPNRRVIPLDLFPAEFINSLSIFKTYNADLPGDFSGGLVDILLKPFPETLTASLGMSTSANTQSTFQNYDSYSGGAFDYFGFDDGTRALPGPVAAYTDNDRPLPAPRTPENADLARSFKDIWTSYPRKAGPNLSLNGNIGNRIGPFGFNVGGSFSNEVVVSPNTLESNFRSQDFFHYDVSNVESKLGAVATAYYEATPNHRFNFRALYDHIGNDTVTIGSGQTGQGPYQNVQRFEFSEEAIAFGQISGEHNFDVARVDWRTAFSQTTESVPDTRTLVYNADPEDPTGPQYADTQPPSGTRIFGNLNETLTDSAVDVTVPFTTALPWTDVWDGLSAKLRFGPAYAYRDRTSDLLVFFYDGPSGGSPVRTEPPETIFGPGNFGPKPDQWQLTLTPDQARSSFDATEEIAALYGMSELPIIQDKLKLIAGARGEYSDIRLNTYSDFSQSFVNLSKTNLDPMPGVNLVYSPRSDMNVRGAWSETVSRPEFRELSPLLFPAVRGQIPTVGNPYLTQARIDNADLRWEWFLSPTELVSFGVFYKSLDNPITKITTLNGSQSITTFANSRWANLYGFEAEGRKNLGDAWEPLRPMTFQANVAWLDSTVRTPLQPIGVPVQNQSRTKHTLTGQAPFTVNASLEWADPTIGTFRILYNTIGRNLNSLGTLDPSGVAYDIYDERRDQLDFVYLNKVTILDHVFNLKASVENITNDPYRQTQGEGDVGGVSQKYTTGVKFGVGLSYAF